MFRLNSRLLILALIGIVCTAATVTALVRRAAPSASSQSLIADGYGGPISLSLTTDSHGRIASLSVLRHQETRAYTGDIDAFLKQFIGKGPGDALEPGRDIDAITGATVTSNAITRAVSGRLKKTPPPAAGPPRGWYRDILAALVLLGISLAALFRRDNGLRWVAMAAGFIYLGLVIQSMFSAAQPAAMALMSPPSMIASPRWWTILTLAGLPAFILGRIYCSGVCPFALVQEFLYYAVRGKRHGLTPPPLSPQDRQLERIKYIVLIGLLIICTISGNASAAAVEPFITFFTGHGTTIAWTILVLVLAASAFRFRFFCRVLCPAGGLLASYATLAPFKITATPACTSCGDCHRACPTGALRHHKTTDGKSLPVAEEMECILCGHCLRACPNGSLILGRRR